MTLEPVITLPYEVVRLTAKSARKNILAEKHRLEQALIARVKPDFDRAHAEKDTFKAKFYRFIMSSKPPPFDIIAFADSKLYWLDRFADHSPYNPEHKALRTFEAFDLDLFSKSLVFCEPESDVERVSRVTITVELWNQLRKWANKSGTENE